MTTNFLVQSHIPDLFQTLKASENNLLYNRLNCMRVAIVEEFFPENLTVKCQIANKLFLGLNPDGSQILRDYPPIYAKVHYFGWGDVGATYPITKGMEGFLLFNDREIESWFINGNVNGLAYGRCHDYSDGVFICGVHSIPNMIQIATDALNLFYKSSNILIGDGQITINGNTVINGNLQVNGEIKATGDIIAGNISLMNHTHGGVEAGSGNTGAPQ